VPPEPQDIDAFLVMADTFDVSELSVESRLLFDHGVAQATLGRECVLGPSSGRVAKRTGRGR
jgi:hypothetical protein